MSLLRSFVSQPKNTWWTATLGGMAILLLGVPLVLRQSPTVLLLFIAIPVLAVTLYSHLEWGTLLLLLLAPVSVVIADFFPDSRLTILRDIALIGILALWMLRQQLRGELHLPERFLGAPTRPLFFFGLSVLGGIAIGLLERSPLQVAFGLKVLVFYLPLSFIIAAQVKTDEDALRVGRAIVVAAVWSSAYMLFKYLAPAGVFPQYDRGYRNIGLDDFARFYVSELLRLNALALPLAGALAFLGRKTALARIMDGLAFMFLVIVLVMGSKRIVIIATMVGLLVAIGLVKKWRLGLLVVCAIAVAFWFLPERGYGRWTDLLEGEDRSSEMRLEELQSFWLPFAWSHPMGSGVGTFSAVSAFSSAWADIGQGFATLSWGSVEIRNVHNGFLLVYAELGLVGLVSYLWLLGSVATGCVHAIRTSRSATLRSAGIGVVSALIAFAVHDLAAPGIITFPMSFYFWAVCGLGIAVSRIAGEANNRQGA